ncbi:MAG: hypothetical protein H6815_11630 [Phycisphaeraceae bacterium]|nr:hypothetical protein [Phycisphaerales bacterium]MCB9861089.1 hypothetical protein [Phycisphaeraceae bacterium]
MPRRSLPTLRQTITVSVLSAAFLGATGCAFFTDRERPVSAVKASGLKAMEAGDLDLARLEFEEYVARKPSAEGRFLAGQVALRQGDYRNAIDHLWIAHDSDPNRSDITDMLANALLESGREAELSKFLHDQTREHGSLTDYLRLGKFAEVMGDADTAEQAYLTAAAIDKGQSVEPQIALADLYQTLGDKERTLDRLAMALYLDPENTIIADRIRSLGEIPGQTFMKIPTEAIRIDPAFGTEYTGVDENTKANPLPER